MKKIMMSILTAIVTVMAIGSVSVNAQADTGALRKLRASALSPFTQEFKISKISPIPAFSSPIMVRMAA